MLRLNCVPFYYLSEKCPKILSLKYVCLKCVRLKSVRLKNVAVPLEIAYPIRVTNIAIIATYRLVKIPLFQDA
jgi:hypothetical protein